MIELQAVGSGDAAELERFLREMDLTTSAIGSPGVALWVLHDEGGYIVASTGYEISGTDVLIRSVAVDPEIRRGGLGLELARYALERATEAGATHAWLFSRRSGPFWQKLGFAAADRAELARRLASTQQVQYFQESGRLATEVAWSRQL